MARTIQQFFKFGLDREIPQLATKPAGLAINLGPGRRKRIPETVGVGGGADAPHNYVKPETLTEWDGTRTLVEWRAPEPLPFVNDSIAEIHAYQFMEHLSGEDAIATLRECERVLKPDGVLNIVTPYFNSQHMSQALDHKSFWSEETWHWLFGNEYYADHEGNGWALYVHCCFIMGIVYRNLDLFTQLVKF